MWLEGFLDIELLGQGGVGDVYRARRASTGALVAIKFLRQAAADITVERELQALVGLQGHPNVVHVEEVIRVEEHFGLVMEFAPGGSVLDLVQRSGGHLSTSETVLVGQQTASALADAHARGFIHRDIKPHNLLIGSFGQIKVCDFGIAAIAARDGLRTIPDALTPRYASPEELRGDPTITSATDVYSLGATLHHVLTGQYLTAPSTPDNSGVLATWQPEADLEPHAAETLRDLVRRMTAFDPAARPSAHQVADTLDRLAFGLGERRTRRLSPADDRTVTGARPTSPIAHARSLSTTNAHTTGVTSTGARGRRSPWVLVGVAGALVSVLAAVLILVVTRESGSRAAPPADRADRTADDDERGGSDAVSEPDSGSDGDETTAPATAAELERTTVPASTTATSGPSAAAASGSAAAPATTHPSPTTAPPAPTTTVLTEEAAHQQLNELVEEDRPVVASLAGMWVPQLSIKWHGAEDNGRIYTWIDILRDHIMFRLDRGAILAFSTDVETNRVDTFFTIVPQGSVSREGVKGWCDLHGYRWEFTCIPRLVLG